MKKEGLVQNLARSPHRLAALWFAVLAVALANCSQAPAQNVVTLVDYTNVWRYLDTGADPGPDWATTNYNDSVWPAGPGPLGVEPGVPYGYFVRIGTPLMLGSPSTPAHFFRTHFQFDPTNAGPGLEVTAELLIDDGCVLFLNGTEVGRLRVTPGQTYSNYANGFQTAEGTPEFLTIAQSTLLAGDNLLAVEIHQNHSGSSDVLLGLRLRIGPSNAPPSPSTLAILSEPQDTEVEVGNSTSLTVVNSGSPANFQWFRDGNPVANATSNTLAFSSAQTNQSGLYSVVLSNSVSFIQSRVARLSVIPNLRGPRLINGAFSVFSGTPRIVLIFNERLQPASAQNTNNYLIEKLGAGISARPTNAIYSSSLVVLGGFSSNFFSVGSRYLATVNNVRDASPATNIIAPNSQITLIWSPTNELFGINHPWHYHASALDDPSSETAAWFDPNFQENSFWQQGVGPFYGDLNAPTEPGTYTVIPFQLQRTLFRTSFVAPPDLPSVVSLVFSGTADSGVILHLNGTELLRANLPAAPAPLYIYSRTIGPGSIASLAFTVQTTNLVHPGQTNWLTAAIHQKPFQDSLIAADMTLFFGPSIQFFNPDRVLPPPQQSGPPILNFNRLNSSQAQLSWIEPGFALEGTTNSANPQPGPWFEVPNMANPFVLDLNQPYRLLRLRK
jgi:hypothetical protein